MKIATNVDRDAFGGITISNLALFDWLIDGDATVVGVEYIVRRHLLGAAVFQKYPQTFFRHHIVGSFDIVRRYPWTKVWNLKRKWRVLIDVTKKILEQESPDVVLINGTYSLPWILAQAASEMDIPIVLRYAGVMKKEVGNLGYFVRRRLARHEREVASLADAIIFPSNVCKEVVEREVLFRALPHATIVPNPIGSVGKVVRNKAANSAYTIACIGRWTNVKNFQAFFALHKSLLLSGWSHRAVLVTQPTRTQIPKTIERLGPMAHGALQDFYATVDLVVVPSHFETFSNVAAEAIAHGCSVLTSNNVGFAEVLREAGLGRMVIGSFDDADVVSKAVQRIAQKKLTEKERRAVLRILDSHRIHEEIYGILDSTLSRSKE